MNPETKAIATGTAPTTLVTTIVTAILAGGGTGSFGDEVHTFIATLLIEHKNVMYGLIAAFIVLTRIANKSYEVYPDKALRPKWAQWLVSFFPTTPPPKEA